MARRRRRDAFMLLQFWSYAGEHQHELVSAVQRHVALSLSAVGIAILIGLPVGIWTARSRFGPSVVSVMTAARVVPSLAVLALVLPVLGIGYRPALVALVLLACPPILINTDVAFRGIEPAVREAALGMGMGSRQMLQRVEYPLAFPVVIAGIRTSTVEVIASATLAAFIGGGGLGDLILDGLANNDVRQLLLGGVSVALLALWAEALLGWMARAAARRSGRYGVA